MKKWLRVWRERALARAERRLAYIQSLIDKGGWRLGPWTTLWLNLTCDKIKKLDRLLK